jgi:predicted dithiol-disulfide oxidoreductase (DUF899 family)
MSVKIVSREEAVRARTQFLKEEKEFTRQRDELSRRRRELPWVKVEKDYVFDGPAGPRRLGDLFDGRGQLIVYHFMFGPTWEEGCPSCSYVGDHLDGMRIHLAHRDVSLAAVSRAPIARLEAFRRRMGWQFPWVSSGGNAFNADFHVSPSDEEKAEGKMTYNYRKGDICLEDLPGVSVFAKSAQGAIHHTYSSYARGLDLLIGAYNWLDLVPKGRDEDGLKHSMAWVRHHDRYDDGYVVDATSPYVPPKDVESCCGK